MRKDLSLSIALGDGLAAACGFRVFVPLLSPLSPRAPDEARLLRLRPRLISDRVKVTLPAALAEEAAAPPPRSAGPGAVASGAGGRPPRRPARPEGRRRRRPRRAPRGRVRGVGAAQRRCDGLPRAGAVVRRGGPRRPPPRPVPPLPRGARASRRPSLAAVRPRPRAAVLELDPGRPSGPATTPARGSPSGCSTSGPRPPSRDGCSTSAPAPASSRWRARSGAPPR